jgi:hypothetical protein
MQNTSEKQKLSSKVRRALDDLAEIRQSLLSMSESSDMGVPDSDQCLDIELAGELKSVVDGLRRLLWAYIEALSVRSGRAPHEVLSWYKMELAVEMLRSLRPHSTSGQAPVSDLEHLINSALVIASQYSAPDRHC